MKAAIALFRGINVGGRHLLPMKELGVVLEKLGCRKVRTYIQSGNAAFLTNERDTTRLSKKIGVEIRQRHGFEPDVRLLWLEDFEKAIAANPFPEAQRDPKSLHVSFLASRPKDPDLSRLESLKKASERFHLKDRVFYLHAPEGVGRSKLAANVERVLGVSMTDRNWRTVCKIRDMAKELGAAAGKLSATAARRDRL